MRVLAAVSLLVLSACVSANKIRANSEVIKTDIDRARRGGALRCAPRELATAEVNLEFASLELGQGASGRAYDHIKEADSSIKKALALSRNCGPKQVLVREGLRVEAVDTDSDGIPDNVDQCVDQPEDKDGFQDEDGCPDPDNDGDGILDAVDRCPDQAEDKDGFQDEDGCPDLDNDADGILDTQDKCPNQAGPASMQGCPVLDRDNDGINDEVDRCPDEPEDKDGFQDEDGCPDLDNDADGIPDAQDKCPNEPGVPEEEGCPKKYKMVVVKKDRIEIKQQIKFKTASGKIVGNDSFAILQEVAQALNDNPQIKKIRVEGHTDSVGNDATNLKLSQQRANSVMAELIKRGVSSSRLEAVGFGETKPIASNATATGRAENRRTEFNVIEQ